MTDADTKGFTGIKLDWLKCVAYDPLVSPRAFEIGFCIFQHVNARTKRTRLSDQTISDETGSCPRDVQRGRNQLRDAGWLKWTRTGDANIYEPLFGKMDDMLDSITDKRDQRKYDRENRRHGLARDQTRESNLKGSDTTSESSRDTTTLSHPDPTQESIIHLRANTVVEHLLDSKHPKSKPRLVDTRRRVMPKPSW